MADWYAAVASEGKPLVFFDRSNSPTLSDMAAQSNVWSSVRGSNQQGGDMLTGATVVHRKEALYGLGESMHVELEPILSHFQGSVSIILRFEK